VAVVRPELTTTSDDVSLQAGKIASERRARPLSSAVFEGRMRVDGFGPDYAGIKPAVHGADHGDTWPVTGLNIIQSRRTP
jgi:hypothetical protein